MKLFWIPLLAVLLLTGCTRRYVITTSNGRTIDTIGKPKIQGGFYVYKDALGRQQSIHTGRVTEISPASMMRKEEPQFNPKVINNP